METQIKERNPLLVLVLTMVTFGIYYLYWIFAITKELNPGKDSDWQPKPILAALLGLITFGIYWLYWGYKMQVYIASKNNTSFSIVKFLTFAIPRMFGMGLMQEEINELA